MSWSKRITCAVVFLAIAFIAGFGGYQWSELHWAHASFDNYYAFRGCTQLLSRNDTSGTCKTSDGETIEIVSHQGRWYLNGDLPGCFLGICL